MEIQPIAKIYNDFDEKFAVPRQSNLVCELKSKIIFENQYASSSAIKGLEGFSHIWLIWEFDKNSHKSSSLTVRPPRLGGNTRVGVFATRSPFRPNPLGLSSVKLESIEYDENNKPYLIVSGADLINSTPIYDIKPYIKESDCHENAVCGFVDEVEFNTLDVKISSQLLANIDKSKQEALISILQNDVRPAYQRNDNKCYGFKFAGYEIKFNVKGTVLTVTDIINEQ